MDYPHKELVEIEAAMNADDAKNPMTVALFGIAQHFLSDVRKIAELADSIDSQLIDMNNRLCEIETRIKEASS